jgi:RNA polymerase sigma-B factor
MKDFNQLFAQYKETGDIAIRNQIAEEYLYIADILAKKFVGRGVDYDDLKQVAALALVKGIDRFDPSLGMQFTTFITPTITGEIKNYFRDKSRAVKLPRRLGEINSAVKKYIAQYQAETGAKPENSLISPQFEYLTATGVIEVCVFIIILSSDSNEAGANIDIFGICIRNETSNIP